MFPFAQVIVDADQPESDLGVTGRITVVAAFKQNKVLEVVQRLADGPTGASRWF